MFPRAALRLLTKSCQLERRSTASSVQGSHLEQVVKVSTKKTKVEATGDASNSTDAVAEEANAWESDPDGTGVTEGSTDEREDVVEQDVDRLIDADSNEYVLSRSREGFALTLDPYLIQVRPLLLCTRIRRRRLAWHLAVFCACGAQALDMWRWGNMTWGAHGWPAGVMRKVGMQRHQGVPAFTTTAVARIAWFMLRFLYGAMDLRWSG